MQIHLDAGRNYPAVQRANGNLKTVRWLLPNYLACFCLFFISALGLPVQANMAEHQAVLDLVSLADVDRQVVRDGPWSDPATWSGGIIPQADENLHVPAGRTLLVDVSSETTLGTLRVDGTLSFPTNLNVKLKLDTLVTTETGLFVIGSEDERVAADKKVEIVIANNGAIDRVRDPFNIGRGIILNGPTRIYGAEKSAFHKLAQGAALNSAQITLDADPTGWAKGDVIAITAVKFRNKQASDSRYITEDELRKINAISGRTITLGQVDDPARLDPLQYSHVPTIRNMPVYVANLTRNVVFSGEGGQAVPASQRGHFMLMHNPDVIIKGTSFNYLGRTDKSIPIDDYLLDSYGNRIKDADGNFIKGPSNNPRGRYAVHFHHTGTDIRTPPAICSGNVVIGSRGWGFVVHTSHVIMENNASFDVYGSHYVAEDGNELGAFRNNIAIKSEGRRSYSKYGTGNHDLGHTGHGFWLETRNMVMDGNVISGVYNSGVMYFHRNYEKGVNLQIPVENLLVPYKELAKGLDTIFYERIPLTHEKNTTVLASGGAMDVIKSSPNQNHEIRSTIEGLKAYSVLNGLGLQYTRKYNLTNIDLVADKALVRSWHKGMSLARMVQDVVLNNVKLEGFIHPFYTGTEFLGQPDQTDMLLINVSVDGRPVNLATDLHEEQLDIVYNYDPNYQRVLDAAAQSMILDGSYEPELLRFTPDASLSPDFPTSYNYPYSVKGVVNDSLGERSYVSVWGYYQLQAAVKKGYYLDAQGAKYVVLTDLMHDRLTGAVGKINTYLKLLLPYKELGPYLGRL